MQMPSGSRAKKKTSDYALFGIVYEDGSLSSNRKVPTSELGGLDRDQPARAIVEAQGRKIVRSGH